MKHQVHTTSTVMYQTSGSCALAPEGYPYLRLVEDADIIVYSKPHHQNEQAYQSQEDHNRAVAKSMCVLILSLLLLFGFLFVSNRRAAQVISHACATQSFEAVTVQSEESLWSLASRYQIDGLSTAQVVDVIEQQNKLDSALVRPGDTIYVPVG